MKLQMQNRPLDSFSYASLTDMVLQLLIFFMLTASFVSSSGIKVELPRASTGTPPSDQHTITISITSDYRIYLNNTEVSIKSLRGALDEHIREYEALKNYENTEDYRGPIVILNADKDVNLQRAIEIIDIAKTVGCTRYLLATDTQTVSDGG
jgi:biopolymer transport protein ExbD